MDSTFGQLKSPSCVDESSQAGHQSSSAQKTPRGNDRFYDLSTVFVYPSLVKGPILGMSAEQHAAMMQEAEKKLPRTPPRNSEEEEVQQVTPQSTSPKPFRFGGITSNDAGSGSLCELHILEDDATFQMESLELQKVQNEILSGGFKELKSLMKTSLAAVALRLGNPDQPHPCQVSGFRLGRDTIITCAHFTTWPETKQGFMEKARMFHSGGNGLNEALQVRKIKTPTSGLRNRFQIRLSAIRLDRDLAVFHILTRPHDDDENVVIDPSQMLFVAEHVRAELRKTEFCWSVGYNLAINQKEFNECWARFFKDQTQTKQAQIALAHHYEQDRPPSMKELKPLRRTVAFGKVREEGADEHGRKLLPHQEYIDLSAWHGRSGAMVCVYDGDNKRARVCGVVLGGHINSDFNYMNVFTSDIEEWVYHATRFQDVTNNPAEFDRRFIRSM